MRKALLAVVLAIGFLALSSAAQAAIISYQAVLNGPTEGTVSLGTGSALVIIDDVTNLMQVQASFTGLRTIVPGGTTAAHIHCCTALPGTGTAGVATTTPSFPLFPLGVTSGTFNNTFDLTLATSYNPAFVTAQGGIAGARTALLGGLAAGTTYFNIHTMEFPGGEIRGFLTPVPEPTSLALIGLGVAAAIARRRRR